jgi:hypothetical protein
MEKSRKVEVSTEAKLRRARTDQPSLPGQQLFASTELTAYSPPPRLYPIDLFPTFDSIDVFVILVFFGFFLIDFRFSRSPTSWLDEVVVAVAIVERCCYRPSTSFLDFCDNIPPFKFGCMNNLAFELRARFGYVHIELGEGLSGRDQ